MPYQASRQSLFDNVGGTVAPRTQVDVEGAIEALTGGATSLIHATMLRKQAGMEAQRREEEMQMTRDKNTRDAANQDWEHKYKEGEARRADLVAGLVPEHTEQTPTATMARVNMPAMPPMRQTPIAKAMQQGKPAAAGALPAPSVMRVNAPEAPKTAPLPASTLKTTTIPEHYDPERSQRMMGLQASADARAEQGAETRAAAAVKQREQIAATAAVRAAANATNIKIAEIRANAAKGGAAGRTLTPNAISQVVSLAAESMVAAHQGHTEELSDWIDSDDPEAVKLKESMKALPIAWETYLKNAKQKYMQRTEAPALRLQSGEGGMSPNEAVRTVTRTREIIDAQGKKKTVAVPDTTAKAAAPVAPAPAVAAPVAPVKADTTKKVAKDDYTNDELVAALNAGNETDAAIAAHIKNARKAKADSVAKKKVPK